MTPRGDGTGVPAEGQVAPLTDAVVARMLPVRSPRGHKGSHGTLLVVAGSLEYAGAAVLVAHAAQRAGAGLVCLCVPASLQPIFATRVLEAITVGLPDASQGPGGAEDDLAAGLERMAARAHDALVVGPGLQPTPGARSLVEALLTGSSPSGPEVGRPAVLDAGALTILADRPEWWTSVRRPCVLTPHPGEFRRLQPDAVLTDDDAVRASLAGEAARTWGQVVVLKGARTVVAAPDGRRHRLPFENPALATAGTGDVLSGTIGALLAQGMDPFSAACAGAYLHGAAGEAIRDRLGDAGLVASDLPYEVALARRRLAAIAASGDRRLGFAPAGATR